MLLKMLLVAAFAVSPGTATLAQGVPAARVDKDKISFLFPAGQPRLLVMPAGRPVAVPEGKVSKARNQFPGWATLYMATQETKYEVHLNFYAHASCEALATSEDNWARGGDEKRRAELGFERLDNVLLDQRWAKTYSQWNDFSRKHITYCLDGPNSVFALVIDAPGGQFDQDAVKALGAAIADAIGPGTEPLSMAPNPLAWVTGVANSPTTRIEGVFPRSMEGAVQSCLARSRGVPVDQLSCGKTTWIVKSSYWCQNGMSGDWKSAKPSCEELTGYALKEKDYAAAAVYQQRMCDAGEKKSCKKALEYLQQASQP
ncbi:MAG: hypothetical protein IT483_15945 [Gammaproteobacteria bacterium]|nr:hypothetical protein [Gammaproteobacteria bacterium]